MTAHPTRSQLFTCGKKQTSRDHARTPSRAELGRKQINESFPLRDSLLLETKIQRARCTFLDPRTKWSCRVTNVVFKTRIILCPVGNLDPCFPQDDPGDGRQRRRDRAALLRRRLVARVAAERPHWARVHVLRVAGASRLLDPHRVHGTFPHSCSCGRLLQIQAVSFSLRP